jgi:hypothetical protein
MLESISNLILPAKPGMPMSSELNLIDVNSPHLIEVSDEQARRFDVTGFDTANNPHNADRQGFQARFGRTTLVFQSHVPKEGETPDGITDEVLFAILEKRLESYNCVIEKCPINSEALLHLQLAHGLIRQRTLRDETLVTGPKY